MNRLHKFKCHSCGEVINETHITKSSEVGVCYICGSDDLSVVSEYGVGFDYKIVYNGSQMKLPRPFKCSDCTHEFDVNARNFVRDADAKCPHCQSLNTSKLMLGCSFRLNHDWTDGKTDEEIADYLVPDENGNYKDPF